MAFPDEIHPDLPHWCRELDFSVEEDRQQKRWDAICELVESSDLTLIDTMVRLAFAGRPAPSASSVARVEEAFLEHDPAFRSDSNGRELQILAACALAVLIDADFGADATGALAVATSFLMGGRSPTVPVDLQRLSAEALVVLADRSRNRVTPTHVATKALGLSDAGSKVRSSNDWNAVATALDELGSAAEAAIAQVAKSSNQRLRRLNQNMAVRDEELDMLWWLLGKHSEDLDCAIEKIPSNYRPLVVAKQLADLTAVLPGPRSIRGILSRAELAGRKKVALTAAVNDAPTEWLEALLPEDDASAMTLPAHFAIRRRLETGAGETWIAGWAAASGLEETLSLKPLDLAEQFYRERLLVTSN